MPKHVSDSTEQQNAEAYLLKQLEVNLDCSFSNEDTLPVQLSVKPDAIDLEKKIVVEVYARVGELKGAQLHKVKGDILKLLLVQHHLDSEWRKVLCFASEEAAKYVKGKSWVADAVSTFGIEVHVISLPENIKGNVVSAQKRQRMVNQS